jgi:anti-sigma regulatory factor (Ser/Thr protein kinase)
MTARPQRGYVHDVFFYAAQDDLVAWAAPFLREGIEAGEHAVVVGEEPMARALLEAVGDDGVLALPREHIFQRVPVAIASYQQLMTDGPFADGRRVRLVSEVDFGPTRETQQAWAGFESVINRYLAPYDLWATCLYDTRHLTASAIVDGIMTHPHVRDRGGRRINDDYVEPAEFLRSLGSTIPTSLTQLASFRLDRKSELSAMRASVDRVLAENGMRAGARANCLVTVGELTANSFLHGVPPVEVNLSRAGEHQLVLDVTDHGIGFDDPFFGYVVGSPEGLPTEGRGLWMVRHMCTSIEAAHLPGGFRVRAAFDERQPRFLDLLS